MNLLIIWTKKVHTDAHLFLQQGRHLGKWPTHARTLYNLSCYFSLQFNFLGVGQVCHCAPNLLTLLAYLEPSSAEPPLSRRTLLSAPHCGSAPEYSRKARNSSNVVPGNEVETSYFWLHRQNGYSFGFVKAGIISGTAVNVYP